MGIPRIVDEGKVGEANESVVDIAKRHIDVAAGRLDMTDFAVRTRRDRY